jgi:hypothetical protein
VLWRRTSSPGSILSRVLKTGEQNLAMRLVGRLFGASGCRTSSFSPDLSAPSSKSAIEAGVNQPTSLGISIAPVFSVKGVPIGPGTERVENFKQLIDAGLAGMKGINKP